MKQALKSRAQSEVNELGNILKNKLVGRGRSKKVGRPRLRKGTTGRARPKKRGRPKGSKVTKLPINRRLLKGKSFINTPILKRGGRRKQNIETL